MKENISFYMNELLRNSIVCGSPKCLYTSLIYYFFKQIYLDFRVKYNLDMTLRFCEIHPIALFGQNY